MKTSFISLSPHASSLKGEDPWDVRFQSGCKIQAGEIPPFQFETPREYYRLLRTLWGYDQPIPISLLRNRIAQTFQPAQALVALLERREIFPKLFSSGAAICETGFVWKEGSLPFLPELCQTALLWAIAGQEEAACKLAAWLYPFLQEESFLSLWCSEKDYDEKEGLLSYSLLLRSFGEWERSSVLLQKIKGAIDPFFFALAKKAPFFDSIPSLAEKIQDLDVGLTLFKNQKARGALTLSGEGTSLGVIRFPQAEVRAFGPQSLPLSESKGFGIRRAIDGTPLEGWMQCAASPEIWFRTLVGILEEECQIDLQFFGEELTPFVFYIRGKSCQIVNQIFKTKSLHSYGGEATRFHFPSLTLESAFPIQSQLIPLAGDQTFWGADFLLSFEISSSHPRVRFILR